MLYAAVDLFCGIGGLTKGLELSGINVVAGYDIDASCQFAYEANNKAKFINEDIVTIKAEELLKHYPQNSIRILVGCAPCQPFSRYSSKYRKKGHKDDKWKLLYSFQRLVKECNPEIVSMENVPNLAKEKVFKDFVKTLHDEGYNVSWKVVYCPDYGVPQHRKRLVLLASKFGGIELILPIYNEKNYLTVRDAIGKLRPLQAGEVDQKDPIHRASSLSIINKKRIRASVQGGTWRDWSDDLKLECHIKKTGKTFPSVYGRMEWDKPSPTITTQFFGYGNGRFGHPVQDRAISLREGAILQSFPLNYKFVKKNSSVSKRELATHIGNAVPVKLGEAIGISISRHLENNN